MLIVGRDAETQAANAEIVVWGDKLEVVSPFKYLGCLITSDNTLDAEIVHKIASANVAFLHLGRAKVWSSRALSTTTLQFLQSIVMSVLLYGAEIWTVFPCQLS